MKPEDPNYNQPVAYDADGRPLYAHPPQQTVQPAVTVTPITRQPAEPTSEMQRLHEESVRKYPQLNLSENEYVLAEIKRHPAGLVPVVGLAISAVIVIILSAMFFHYQQDPTAPLMSGIMMPALLMVVLICLLAYAAVVVYQDNKLYITNESVVGESRSTLFAHEEKTVSLADVVQASFSSGTILQSLLHYGTIHILVAGDNAEYDFKYAPDPKKYVEIITNQSEKMKGR